MNNTVSIVIPAYNAENVIERCLKSIIAQTYPYYEIIVINDGSKDATLCVLNRFKKDYSQYSIEIIDIENGGVSNARNIGLDAATGKWVCFVDADDYLEPNYLDNLIREWKPHRWVLCHFYRVKNGERKQVNSLHGRMSKCEITSLFLDTLVSQPWNKLFEKAIIDKYNIRFDRNLAIAEDFFFNMTYFNYCKDIFVIEKPLYNYCVFTSGLNNSEKKKSAYLPILVKQYEILYHSIKNWCGKGDKLYQLDQHFIVQIWRYSGVSQKDLCRMDYYRLVETNMKVNSLLFILCMWLYKLGMKNLAINMLRLQKKIRMGLKIKYYEKVTRVK